MEEFLRSLNPEQRDVIQDSLATLGHFAFFQQLGDFYLQQHSRYADVNLTDAQLANQVRSMHAIHQYLSQLNAEAVALGSTDNSAQETL